MVRPNAGGKPKTSTEQIIADAAAAAPRSGGTTVRPSTPKGKPKTLNYQQLVALARKHGANTQQAATLAGIALAESSGRTGAVNTANRNGSTDYGLWQVNSVHKAAGFDPSKALDPDYNAKWAVRLMKESKGFTPWVQYKNGAYRQYMPGGAAASTDIPAPQAGRGAPAASGNPGAAPSGGAGSLQSILDMGMSFVGTPYKWGGAQPGGFDCSGLLQYIFAKNGVQIPRVNKDQARAGVGVAAQDAQAGDLIAFDNSADRPGVDHIGIYLGNGLMLQAPRAGKNVEVVKVNLGKATTIRRIPQVNTSGLQKQGSKYVYPAQAGQGATNPTQITTATGGSDPAMAPDVSGAMGADPAASLLGPDGKVDPGKAIAKYGYIAELAKSVPDIKRVMEQAIKEGWEPQRFQAEIQRTQWWRTTSEATRANELLKKTNPGEYRRRRQLMVDRINLMARKLGVQEGSQRVFILAERFLSLGSTDQEIERLIAADVRVAPPVGPDGKPVPGAPTTNTGETAVTVDGLRALARSQQVQLDPRTEQQWVSAVMKGDLTVDAFKSFLLAEAKKRNPDIPASAFERGETVDSFRQKQSALAERLTAEAKSFLVPLSDEAVKKWASQITAGDLTPESFSSYVKEQAKSLFPTLGAAIDRGVTVAQYAEPYRQIAAQTLEINPEDVDFSNPMYGRALLQVDPKTGERTSMGLAEYQEYLRKQPAWQRTRQANEQAASLTESILRTFGATA